MKLSILFLLIALPGYFVCAEPLYGGFFSDMFQSASYMVGRSIGFAGSIVSNIKDGVKTTATGIYHSAFGHETKPNTDTTSQSAPSPAGGNESTLESTAAGTASGPSAANETTKDNSNVQASNGTKSDN